MKDSTERSSPQENASLTRRDFLRLAGAAGLGLLAPGCAALPAATPGRSSRKVQLVYQDAREEWFLPMVQEMLDEFHAAHPNIQVYYTPEPQDPQAKEEKMLADMQAGTAPDVFQGCCSWFPIWAQKGYTIDLAPYVAADLDPAIIDEWDPAQYAALSTPGGQQYALPKYKGSLALYFNLDLFDRYGVSYPDGSWDHDDYHEAMRHLTRDTDGDGQIDLWGSMMYISWDRVQMHVNGWGGHLVDPADPKKSCIADPEALAAQEWLRARMWDDGVMATALDVNNLWPDDVFIAGKIAMLEDGSWRLRHILSNAPFRVGAAPFPAGPARRVTLATTDGYAIYSGTRHPEAAWELVKFLISKEYGLALARAGFLQPARASILDNWIGYVQSEFPRQTREMNLSAFADGHRKGYSVVAEVAANMGESTRIAHAAWDQIFTLGQQPVEMLREAAALIEQAQQEAR